MARNVSVLVLSLFVSLLAAAAEIDDLAKNLRSRNVETRMQAAEQLGKLKTAAAAELLAQALSDREPRVRSAAALALWDSSDVAKGAIPALRNTLADSDPYVVACAAGALIAMDVPQEEVADPLRGVLQRGDPYDRFLAARLLTGAEPAGNLVAPITEYLARNLPEERRGVSATLRRSENFELGAKALQNLGETQDRTQIDPLMAQLREAPAAMVPPILTGLGELKPPPDRWVETLISQLGSSAPPVRRKAVELLGKQKGAADIRKWAPAVARLTIDPDADVRGWALSTLSEGKGLAHDAFSSVVQMVRSERDDHLRARAAEVAGEIGDAKYPIDSAVKSAMGKEALPILSAAIATDSDSDVRANALGSLSRLQLEPSAVVPVMARAAVEGKTSGFRTSALVLLGNLGSDAAPASEAIESLTRDPDPDVARIARATLVSIRSPSPVSSARREASPAPAPADPAVRERGFAVLREKNVEFASWDFARALSHLEEELVRAFLDAGMSPNQRFSYGTPPLQMVLDSDFKCDAKMKSVVNLLLDRGADANGADENGNTVLMTAAKHCDGEMIRLLIKAGARAGAKNTMGYTALDSAVPAANASAAAALVAAGVRLTAEQAKMYREVYKKEPKVLELISMATKK